MTAEKFVQKVVVLATGGTIAGSAASASGSLVDALLAPVPVAGPSSEPSAPAPPVRSTRCATGRVLATKGSEFSHSNGLSPVKARIALMLELMQD